MGREASGSPQAIEPRGAADVVPAAMTRDLQTAEQALLRARIRRALRHGEFVVHYQPMVELALGTPCGIEALVRWQNPSDGLIWPKGFVPFAEESGLIWELGEHVLRVACLHGKGWLDQGAPPVQLGVNVTARQLAQPGFAGLVDTVLRETGFPARLLELEVAERTLVAGGPGMLRTLAALREVGVTLAVDDFGSRPASFDRLRPLPLNRLKIDGVFVRRMTISAAAAQIVAALIKLGHDLGVDVAAKCAETSGQVRMLRELGCLQAQGFYFGRAIPPAAVAAAFGGPPAFPSFSSSELLP